MTGWLFRFLAAALLCVCAGIAFFPLLWSFSFTVPFFFNFPPPTRKNDSNSDQRINQLNWSLPLAFILFSFRTIFFLLFFFFFLFSFFSYFFFSLLSSYTKTSNVTYWIIFHFRRIFCPFLRFFRYSLSPRPIIAGHRFSFYFLTRKLSQLKGPLGNNTFSRILLLIKIFSTNSPARPRFVWKYFFLAACHSSSIFFSIVTRTKAINNISPLEKYLRFLIKETEGNKNHEEKFNFFFAPFARSCSS